MKNKGFTPLEIERKRKRSRLLTGFTLIELLVVVVVIGVLAGMSFVMIQGVIDAARMARNKSFAMGIQRQLALNEVGVWRFDDDPVSPAVIGGVHDASGWGNHGELRLGDEGNTSLEVAWVPGVFGRALSFDGVDDFVLVSSSASLNITGAITIEMWVKVISNDQWWEEFIIRGHNRIETGVPGQRGIWTSPNIYVTNVWEYGQWFHIAHVSTASPARTFLYINGAQKGMLNSTFLPSDAGNLCIGTCNAHESFHGTIDEVRIYNRALKVFEIQKRYVKGLKSLLARGIITEEDFNARIAEIEKNLAINRG